VEEQNGVLNLLPTLPVGSPGTQNKMGKRNVRSFAIPHIPVGDRISSSEYDGVRAFGSETQTETLATIMNKHLQTAKNKFAITLEHLRMGALKGIILDADGSVLYNLYTEFGIAAKTIDFELASDGTEVREKCFELLRHVEDNLKGEIMSEVRCLVSAGFFDALTHHSKVEDAFKYSSAAVQAMGGDIRKGFKFGGVTFEEYRGTATDAAGNVRQFIEAGEGHAFPMGTSESFETVYAPADFLETVNTLGLPLYAKQAPDKFNQSIDLLIQSNPLPICYRPGVLVKLLA
jgi:hypothetical protein